MSFSEEAPRYVICQKLKEKAEGLEAPPFPGPLGQKIFEQISKQAWSMWLSQQTMLINEYRLSLIDPQSKTFLREEMQKYLFAADLKNADDKD